MLRFCDPRRGLRWMRFTAINLRLSHHRTLLLRCRGSALTVGRLWWCGPFRTRVPTPFSHHLYGLHGRMRSVALGCIYPWRVASYRGRHRVADCLDLRWTRYMSVRRDV